MPATRRPRRAAATAAAAAIAGDPLPAPAVADPPALSRAAARPRAAVTPRRTARAAPTTAPRLTRASAAAPEPEAEGDLSDEEDEEPKPKRQRRNAPAKVAKPKPANAAAEEEEAPAASSSRVTRSATRAERAARGPSPPKYVEPASSTDDEDQPEPEPEPAPKMGKGKAKARKTVDDEAIPADWVPHAIDEIVPDHAESSSQAAVVDSQAAFLSQQHFAAAAVPAAVQPAADADENDGDDAEQDDDATNWWRYFPDVLSKTPENVDLAGNQLDANADDGALLAAGVHDRTGFGHWFDPIGNNNGEAAAPPARPMLEDDGEDEEQEAAPAVKPGLERNENQLFLNSESVSLRFRLPMPPASLDMNSFKCLEPSVLADVTARYVPILRVRRPRITDDGFFEYSWGMMTEDIYYVHPDSMTVSDEELKKLTVESFADLEKDDPYYERAKRVQPSPGREEDEKVREDGFVDAVRGIDRAVMDRLVLAFTTDAFWRHDGDWPEEPGANEHQNSYKAGRLFIVWSGANNMWGWTRDHNLYYRTVLRSINGEVYSPPDPTAPQDRDGWGHRYDQYRYELCTYLKTDVVNAALREGVDVPGFPGQMSYLMRLIESRNAYRLPKFYVPDTIEGGHAPAPTPQGFQLQLHDYQQRTLGWLLALERSRRARTVHVHQATENSTPEQRGQFMSTTLRGCPNWIQLGKDGMWVNLATYKTATDPSVWNDLHLGITGLECRGALEVSKMGAGKTVMALSLVAANPFRSVRAIPWDDPADKLKYLVSRATLIVVRSDLVTQWVAEAQKCLPLGAKIVQVATIRDHRDLTWNDVLLADVVIISLAFLQNQNYQKRVAKVAKTGGRYCLPREAYQHSRSYLEWQDSFYRRQRWYKAATPAYQHEYNNTLDAHVAGLHERTRARFGNDKDAVIFDRVYWHRIVIDEIHELSHVLSARDAWSRTNTRVAETLLFTLKTRFRLGLTGTPPLSHPVCVVSLAEAVGVRHLPTTVADAQAFLNTHVRRNEPDLAIPPVHYQTNWVDLTPAEMGLMASYQRQSVRSRLMMCNHHQIHDDVVAATGVTATSVDEVAARIQVVRLDKIESLVKQGRKLQDDIAVLTARMEALVPLIPDDERATMPAGLTISDDNRLVVMGVDAHERLVRYITAPDSDEADMGISVEIPRVDVSRVKNPTVDAKTTARKLVTACTDFADVRGQLRTVAAQHRFMATVLSAIAEAEDQACPVCMEDIARTDPLVITRCGHVFCDACTQTMLGQPRRLCAMCRGDLDGAGATTRLILQPVDEPMKEPDDEEDEDADYAIYGSKIKALVQFVRRVVRADPTAKLILFSQFHRLTALMAHAFTEFGIGNVKLMGGNVISKRRAVTLFRNDPDMKVLFLSAEDSVSGLQLTEANHVVIVHPFLGASEAMARAYEMQGCARAVRAGQEREVTITRFVTRGTIEEELTARRSDLQRANEDGQEGQAGEGNVVEN